MAKTCKVTVNNESFIANCGDLLLDAGLMNGVDMPHDCRAGICGACRVRLVDGRVFGGQDGSDIIRACQARVISDLDIAIEPVPDTITLSGRVIDMERLAPDVTGVRIELPRPIHELPGQYCKVQFRGFPERCYSPTYPLDGHPYDRVFHFHIRMVSGGVVSSVLGDQIRVGHRVKMTGPLGAAYLRPDHAGRIVLVASGTGFAPMWAIAVAAIFERPQRELVFLVAGRRVESMYMHGALARLARFPNVGIIPIVSDLPIISNLIRSGRPTNHIPDLSPDDVVYAAGAPAMTESVARIASAADARCYTDPFVSDTKAVAPGLMAHLADFGREIRTIAAPMWVAS